MGHKAHGRIFGVTPGATDTRPAELVGAVASYTARLVAMGVELVSVETMVARVSQGVR